MSSITSSANTQMSKGLTLLLGTAVGLIVANLYYAQPIVALIAGSLEINPALAGMILMLTQIGYGVGVLFLVPLGDIVENKKLIFSLIGLLIVSLLALAFVTQSVPYFIAAFVLGLGASAVQIIVPYAAHLTPEASRGRVVGSLMSGLMLGIMLSRPIASFLTDMFSWHAVFFLSAALMLVLSLVLMKFLPQRKPNHLGIGYLDLLGSMVQLVLRTPVLRRRGLYQAFMFGAFSLFWTTTPILLAGPEYHLSQTQIALFALAGVAGAIVAPLAGRAADLGMSRQGTAVAMFSAIAAFLMTHIFAPGSMMSLVFLVLSAILLDAGITANLVLGQRAIFSLRAKYRSRLNGLYIAMIFVGGAAGSFLGAWAYAKGGWALTSVVGMAMPALALLAFATEWITGFHQKRKPARA
ncbi:MFS transporter [Bdellovibrio bacteriovorus]|uniref:MFS transporter n=1 Tax=Bdellovibrio bacteriovorus TaxID=959 RepID=A0A150WH22_BDEBC|nr:MFS transporter [Bdellovibrio bacteriovorus]KYG62391.1 MFS transporter [Bdellovibrio bacteriovorus]